MKQHKLEAGAANALIEPSNSRLIQRDAERPN